MIAVAVQTLECRCVACLVCVTCSSAFGASVCGSFTLVGAMVESVTFVALSYWQVFLNVDIVRGDDAGEEFYANVFCFICLLFRAEFDFKHVCFRNYV